MVKLGLINSPREVADLKKYRIMSKIRSQGKLHAENNGVNHPTNIKVFTDGYLIGLNDMLRIAAKRGLILRLEDLVNDR